MRPLCPLLLLLLCTLAANAQDTTRYLIHAGKLFDAENKEFLADRFIFVAGDRIERVTAADGAPHPGYTPIDLSDATVTPGLIDAHTHFLFMQRSGSPMEEDIIEYSDEARVLRGAATAKSHLQAGITTVRDLGNSGQYLDLPLRDAINQGWIEGPRMLVSGPIISPPGGQFGHLPHLHAPIAAAEYTIVRTVDEARAAIVDHAQAGVDVIKICATNDNGLTLSIPQMAAMVEEAHRLGLKVTAHATYDQIIRDAVTAGVDGIEHGYSVTDSTLQLMAEKGVYLVPTDGSFDGYHAIVEAGAGDITDDDIRSFVQTTSERLLRAVAAGVDIVYGSDMYLYSGQPRGTAAKDALRSYALAGVPVADVLRFATLNGARALGREGQLGVIQPGAMADLVAFHENLEGDFPKVVMEGVIFVMKGGMVVFDQQ